MSVLGSYPTFITVLMLKAALLSTNVGAIIIPLLKWFQRALTLLYLQPKPLEYVHVQPSP